MKIGSVRIPNGTVFAPLAGISNLPLRLLVKAAGCGLVCSEMISANGLIYGSQKTRQLLDSTPEEKPLSVQIFGADPEIMADAAQIVADSGADILDINFGCSVKKIVKTGSGAALMRTPELAENILCAVRKVLTIPLTIKIRSGWDASGTQALHLARVAEFCGVDAVAVHPRTATQGFRGKADWSLIQKIKNSIAIPVIGNGDIETAPDALRMRAQTGCDGIMVGRAAIGNPYLFREILTLERGDTVPDRDVAQIEEMMIRYLEASVRYLGEKSACYILRSRLCWFVKGLRNAGRFRESIRFIASEMEAKDLIRQYMTALRDSAGFSGAADPPVTPAVSFSG